MNANSGIKTPTNKTNFGTSLDHLADSNLEMDLSLQDSGLKIQENFQHAINDIVSFQGDDKANSKNLSPDGEVVESSPEPPIGSKKI